MKNNLANQSAQRDNSLSGKITPPPISENVSQALRVLNSRNTDYNHFKTTVIPAIKLLGKEDGVEAIPALEALYKRSSTINSTVGKEFKDKAPVKDLREIIKAITYIGHRDDTRTAMEALGEMLSSAKNVLLVSGSDIRHAPWSKDKELANTDIPLIAKALATFGSAAAGTVSELRKHLDDPIYRVLHCEENQGGLKGKLGSPTRHVFVLNDVTGENQKSYQRLILAAIKKISN